MISQGESKGKYLRPRIRKHCPKCGKLNERWSWFWTTPRNQESLHKLCASCSKTVSARAEKMAQMYRQGVTLEKIGATFDLTRERVRQILKRDFGITREDGGAKRLKDLRGGTARERQVAEARAKFEQKNGIDRDAYRALPRSLHRAFVEQRRNANNRGIAWKLNFGLWYRIWLDSGKLDQRGRDMGKYCMSRIVDSGAYEIGNVHIQTAQDNSREAVKKWLGKKKANRGVFHLYPGTSRPWCAKIRNRSIGYFSTEEEAVIARNAALAAQGA